MKKAVLLLTLAIAFVSSAFAHGNEKHVMGKVTAVSSDSITVQTVKNERITIAVDSSTKFINSGSAATAKDLKVGDRVVVGAEKDGNKLRAQSVRFGKAALGDMRMDHSKMKMDDKKDMKH